MGNDEAEKYQPISAHSSLQDQRRTAGPPSEEYVCVDSYAGSFVPDIGMSGGRNYGNRF